MLTAEEGLCGITDERVLAFRHELRGIIYVSVYVYVLTDERVLAFRHELASLDIYLSIYPSIHLSISIYLCIFDL